MVVRFIDRNRERAEFQFCKMRNVLEMDGSDSYTTV